MSVWILFLSLLSIGIFALGAAVYPIRRSRKFLLCVAVVFIIVLTASYANWGAWRGWHHAIYKAKLEARVQEMLKTMHGPDELIAKLKGALGHSPADARGWVILGKLYMNQQLWIKAHAAFSLANKLNPVDDSAKVNDALCLWEMNHRKFNKKIRQRLQDIVQHNHNQTDALAMLAMDAYLRHDYPTALKHWQHLLTLAPPDSEEARALRRAIIKVQ